MQLKELEFAALFYIEGFLVAKGEYPSNKDIAEALAVSTADVEALLKHPSEDFRTALKKKGFKAAQSRKDKLKEQALKSAALSELTNPGDTRPLNAKLKDLGITQSTFNRWLQEDEFANTFATIAKRRISHATPFVLQAVVSSALNGSVAAQKLHLEMEGEYTPSMNTTVQTITPEIKSLITKLIEVIQLHIHDTELIMRIADDFDKALAPSNNLASLPAGAQKQLELLNYVPDEGTTGSGDFKPAKDDGPIDFDIQL